MQLRVISTKYYPLGGGVTVVDQHIHQGSVFHLEDEKVIELQFMRLCKPEPTILQDQFTLVLIDVHIPGAAYAGLELDRPGKNPFQTLLEFSGDDQHIHVIVAVQLHIEARGLRRVRRVTNPFRAAFPSPI